MDRSTLIRFDDALPLDATPRIDVYGAIHKALRAFMFDTLTRLGRCDATDPAELGATLGALRALLGTMRTHLWHEDTFVHPMIEAACPGAAATTLDDHADHEPAIAALLAQADALEALEPARRPAAAYRLYLRLARFVAENLEHMEIEETHNTAALRAAYDDAAIGAMLERLHATIGPDEAARVGRWIFTSLNHDERVGMLSGMRAAAPAPVFEAEIARVRDLLEPGDWAKLARALGLPAVAGLVEVW